MNTKQEVTWEEIAFKLRTLAYDLNLLQERIISVLFDILYPDDSKKYTLAIMRENKELAKRLINDIDKIMELIEKKVT